MPEFVKDVLKPGTYRADGREVTVTEADLQSFVDDFHRMAESGYAVPVPWEHTDRDDDNGYPISLSDKRRIAARNRAKNNAGWVSDLFVEGDTLKARVDIGLEEDAARLEANGGFVSPQFGRWQAPDGTEYAKPITHLALTTHPVARNQDREFQPVALSELDLEPNDPLRFSLEDAVQFTDTPPAAPPEAPAAPAPDAEPPKADEAMEAMVKRAGECLRQIGIVLPESVLQAFPQDGMQVLCAAIDSHLATKQAAKADEKPADAAQPGQVPAGVNTEPTTVSLSEPANESGEPEAEEPAMSAEQIAQLSELQSQNNALIAQATRLQREDYARRIGNVERSGRCSPDAANGMREMAEQHQFSESGDSSPLDIKLSVYEELPAGAVWDDSQRVQQFSVGTEQDGPFFSGDDVSDERAEELANELAG